MDKNPKRPRDVNQLAKFIVDTATGKDPVYEPDTSAQRAGGKKGGKSKARLLTPEERSEAAQIAASARWKKSDN
jgi:hypothetical protein